MYVVLSLLYNCNSYHYRRMFPSVSIFIRGLEPSALYAVALNIVPADDSRYKFINNRWIAVGRADPPICNRPFVHNDSPQSGAQWMREKVSFSRLKVTNNKERIEDNVSYIHSYERIEDNVSYIRSYEGFFMPNSSLAPIIIC